MQDNQSAFQTNRISNQQAFEKISTLAKALNKPFTEAEIVLKTGLSLDQVKDGLDALIGKYVCSFSVNQDGFIIYHFDFSQKLKDEKFSWKKLRSQFLSLFSIIFRVWITIMFFYYSMVYIIILVKYSIYIFFGFIIILLILFATSLSLIKESVINEFDFRPFENFYRRKLNFIAGRKVYLYPIDKLHKNPIKIIFEFAFGSERQKDHSQLQLEKRILSYVAANNHELTVSDLVLLSGWTVEKASQQIVQLMHYYHAEVKVNHDGFLVYVFPELKEQKVENQIDQYFIWQHLEPLHPFNNNYIFENVSVFIFNTIIFLISSFFLLGNMEESYDSIMGINIHIIPFIDSILIFTVLVLQKNIYRTKRLNKINKNRFYLRLSRNLARYERLDFIDLDTQFLIDELKSVGRLEKVTTFAKNRLIKYENKDLVVNRLSKNLFFINSDIGVTLLFKQVVNINIVFKLTTATTFLLVGTNSLIAMINYYLSSDISTTVLVMFIMMYLFMIYLFLRPLSKVLNSYSLSVSKSNPEYYMLRKGPLVLSLGGSVTKFHHQELEGIRARPDSWYGFYFYIDIASKKFSIKLLESQQSTEVFYEARGLFYEYANRFRVTS